MAKQSIRLSDHFTYGKLLRFTPILAVTTESQRDKRDEAKRHGATGWLVKPVGGSDLLKVVNQVLTR